MDLRRLDHVPGVASVMTAFPYSVDETDPITVAEQLMRQHDVRHVPVVHEDEIIGVVTHRDLSMLTNKALPPTDRARIKVAHVCRREPFIVDLHEPLDRVARSMAERHVGSVIVTRNGRLAGIFTVTDACRVLADVLEARFRRGDGGEAA